MAWSHGSAALALTFLALPVQAQNTAEFPVLPAEAPDPAAPATPSSVPNAPSVEVPPPPLTVAPEPLPPRQPAVVAAPRQPPAPEPPREYSRWYGWQTLLSDSAALTLLFAVGAVDLGDGAGKFVGASLGMYLTGGPVIHATHGNWGRAAGSLGLRVGAPLLGGALGSSLEECSSGEDFCGLAGAVLGGTLGILTAVTVDSAALARETVRDPPLIVPSVRTGRSATWVGISGRF